MAPVSGLQVLLQREAPLRHYRNETLLEAADLTVAFCCSKLISCSCSDHIEAVERGNVLLLRALLVQMRLELSVVSRAIKLAPLIHCDCWNAVAELFVHSCQAHHPDSEESVIFSSTCWEFATACFKLKGIYAHTAFLLESAAKAGERSVRLTGRLV